jgi:hypothetical protein
MVKRGELVMGLDGYQPAEATWSIAADRPQMGREATRKLAKRVGDDIGPRDPPGQPR